jgi:hypothetical protein
MEIRNPNVEIPSGKLEIRMSKSETISKLEEEISKPEIANSSFFISGFLLSNFGFVSNFGIRISGFRVGTDFCGAATDFP